MDERARPRIGREIVEEIAVSRTLEQVVHAHAGERSALLLDQPVELPRKFVSPGRIGEANLALLAEPLALGAVAPPRRRRALGRIELFPRPLEPREVRPARVQPDVEMKERIGL